MPCSLLTPGKSRDSRTELARCMFKVSFSEFGLTEEHTRTFARTGLTDGPYRRTSSGNIGSVRPICELFKEKDSAYGPNVTLSGRIRPEKLKGQKIMKNQEIQNGPLYNSK